LAFATFLVGGYGLALAALALVVFGAYDSYPTKLSTTFIVINRDVFLHNTFTK